MGESEHGENAVAEPPTAILNILLANYKESADEARQHENQRERMTTLIIAIGAGSLGLVTLKTATINISILGIDDLLASGKQPQTLTGTAVSKWIAERLEPVPDSPQSTTANEGPGTTEKKGKKPTIAEILTAIGMALDLWHDSTQTGFATIGRLSHPIRSKGFRHFLLSEFRRQCPNQCRMLRP